MINEEKVNKGLHTCTRGVCKDCPYWGGGGGCVNDLMKDAAELIRQLKNGEAKPATTEV